MREAHGKHRPELPHARAGSRWMRTRGSAGRTLPSAAGEGRACRHLPGRAPRAELAPAPGRHQGCRQLPGHVWAQRELWEQVLETGSAPEPRPPREHPRGWVGEGSPSTRLSTWGHGDRAGTGQWCLAVGGTGGCWHRLRSHLPQRLGAAPHPVLLQGSPGNSTQPPTSKKCAQRPNPPWKCWGEAAAGARQRPGGAAGLGDTVAGAAPGRGTPRAPPAPSPRCALHWGNHP